ncbi:MAG: amidohydrolase family protein [Burkholderiales bacterium]|nr:amidohydrolase family protein [Burkholderiales bacterium]
MAAIDVHAHYVPPPVVEALERAGGKYGIDVAMHEPTCQKCLRFEYGLQVRPFFPRLLEPADRRIEWMHGIGLTRQVLSVWTDIFGYALPAEKGAAWHGLLNDRLADFVASRPDAFSWLASGPLPHAGLAARELERSVRKLGAVGGVAATNVEGTNLGELPLDEYWAAAVELDVPVFLHPAQPAPAPRTQKFALAQVAQYTFDTTLCIGSLIGAGVLDRFPALRLIVSHGGGSVPYLIGRFDCMHERADRRQTGAVAQHAPSAYLRRFWYDTILHDPLSLQFLAQRVQTDRMVLGTDESFPPHEADPLGLLRRANFSAADVAQIGERNPRALFGIPE